jgi:Flp pilus assembly pilin Flp
MRKFVKKIALPRFFRDEEGLVTIEWIGIAAIAGVAAIAVSGVVFTQVASKGKDVPSNLCTNATTETTAVTTVTGTTLAAPC